MQHFNIDAMESLSKSHNDTKNAKAMLYLGAMVAMVDKKQWEMRARNPDHYLHDPLHATYSTTPISLSRLNRIIERLKEYPENRELMPLFDEAFSLDCFDERQACFLILRGRQQHFLTKPAY